MPVIIARTPPPRSSGTPADQLARMLAASSRTYTILGEGNVLVRDDAETFLVKARGAAMATATTAALVRVDVTLALALVHDLPDGDEAAASALAATRAGGTTLRPSVETGTHALLLAQAKARWIAHTHPTPITAVLCSAQAEALVARAGYPPQRVSRIMWWSAARTRSSYPISIPLSRWRGHLARTWSGSVRPGYPRAGRAQYLRNPGTRARVFMAMVGSAAEVLAITDMAVKAARVLATALPCGGPCYLSAAERRRIASRSDEHYRQRALGLTAVEGERIGA